MAFYNTPADMVTPDQVDQATASVIKAIQSIDPATLSALKRMGVNMASELDVDGTHTMLNNMATHTDPRRMAAYFITMLAYCKPVEDHSSFILMAL